MITTDEEAWADVDHNHRWVFNKLEVAKRLGYNCDPSGIPPRVKDYIVRPIMKPIMNLEGMGLGATFGGDVPAGYFWCERFHGRHLSVDYTVNSPTLCVEGTRKEGNPIWRWDWWTKVGVENAPSLPALFHKIGMFYDHINVEYIGNKVVEIHLRPNPDFANHSNYTSLKPVWEDEQDMDIEDLKKIYNAKEFIHDQVNIKGIKRIGFLAK